MHCRPLQLVRAATHDGGAAAAEVCPAVVDVADAVRAEIDSRAACVGELNPLGLTASEGGVYDLGDEKVRMGAPAEREQGRRGEGAEG